MKLDLSDPNLRPFVYPYEMRMELPDLTDQTEIPGSGNWFEDAAVFDVYTAHSNGFRRLVNYVFDKLSGTVKITNKDRSKKAIKTILLNLWRARWLGMPVRYSRNKNYYTRAKRYGKLHFKFDRLLPLIDGMESLGYLQQKEGFFDHDKNLGRQTRMWGTPKLWVLYEYYSILNQRLLEDYEPEELIILRDGSKLKKEIGYRETSLTRKQREQLQSYNQFVKVHEITVDLNRNCEVDNQFLAVWLYNNILTNRISLVQIEFHNKPVLATNSIKPVPIDNQFSYYPLTTYLPVSDIPFYLRESYSLPSMTNTKQRKATTTNGSYDFNLGCRRFLNYLFELSFGIASIDEPAEAKSILEEEFLLGNIGVERLLFQLNAESLHRVYSRGSFKYNGRAYGAIHQMMPKHMRPFIHIDGRPTIEPDFSALHIRMLYHREGIDYLQDPYVVPGGPELRKVFKAVGLIAINAKSVKKAYGAIRQELKDRNIPLPNFERPLITLVDMFKKAHKPIEKYLFSDAGIWLQNLDSQIMNSILIRLKDNGILGLPVHDSVIVQKEHEGILREIMVSEYEAMMGFKPKF